MKFTALWDVMPWHLMEILNLLEEKSSKMLVNFYQALWCHALSCSPMNVKFNKYFSCLPYCGNGSFLQALSYVCS